MSTGPGYARVYLSKPIDTEELIPMVEALSMVEEHGIRPKTDGKAHYSQRVLHP